MADPAYSLTTVRLFFLLTVPLYLADQITKFLVLKFIAPDDARPVVSGFFYLVHVTNTGAAFGSFKNNNGFFIALSFVALATVFFLLVSGRTHNTWQRFGLGLLLTGVLGNLTDRLTHGHVIDFLLFDLHVPFAHPWPAFNVADSCICIAVACFLVHSFREQKVAQTATI